MFIWNNIKSNYNFVDSFSYFDGNYEFVKGDGKLFLVCKVENVDLLNYLFFIFKNYSFFYRIVNNNFGDIITYYENGYYILVEYENRSSDIYDLVKNFDVYKTLIIGKCNWRKSWIDRCDFIERYYGYMVGKYEVIDESIDYYYGMLELAIYYLRGCDYESYLYMQHSYYKFDKISFYDLSSVKLDIKERDFSNYLKNLFFSHEYKSVDIINIISENIDRYDFNFVIARLIYPDYYFDLFDKIVCDDYKSSSEIDINMEKLFDVVSKAYDYEKYVFSIYEFVCLKKDIKKVDFFNLH